MQAMLEWVAMGLDAPQLMRSVGMEPDHWQARVLRAEAARLLLLCHRQAGKSTVSGCLALHTALFEPDSLVLLVSPSLRQSGELFKKVQYFYLALDCPVPAIQTNATSLHLANGSRVVSLPGSPDTIRGFSAPRLVVIDEAALVGDDLFAAVSPMLAVSQGRLACLSTPMGQRGSFHDWWTDGSPGWERIKFTAYDCPRIDREWLEEQKTILGPRVFAQEFLCEFLATLDAVFDPAAVAAAFDSAEPALFPGELS
jgi:hypothetical protein